MKFNKLNQIYQSKGLVLAKNERKYLRNAYVGIENFWLPYAKKAKLIVLAESPLWGKNYKYIYNPSIGCSEFFQRKDLFPIIGSTPKNKCLFLEKLKQKKIVILDISPYALSTKNTQLTYNKIKNVEYQEIIKSCWNWHIKPKIKMILNGQKTNIVFRYLRVKNAAEKLLIKQLRKDFNLQIKSIPNIAYQPTQHKLMDPVDLALKFNKKRLNY